MLELIINKNKAITEFFIILFYNKNFDVKIQK